MLMSMPRQLAAVPTVARPSICKTHLCLVNKELMNQGAEENRVGLVIPVMGSQIEKWEKV